MVTRGKTRMLLFGLVGFFALVSLTQWLSTPGSRESSIEVVTASSSVEGHAITETQPDIDTFGIVMLYYADSMAHVAKRFVDAESYETAALLLKRVFRVRKYILGSDHLSVVEAQQRYVEALRAHEDIMAGSKSYHSTNGDAERVD